MKIPYIKIPITDMYAYLAPCSSQTKGQIFEAVLAFGMYQTWPDLALEGAHKQAYNIVKQLIEREIKSYQKFCKEQKQKIKKYWKETKNTDDTTVLPARNNQSKQEQELKQEQEAKQKQEPELENINIFTVPPALAQDAPDFSGGNSKTLTDVKPPKDKHAERAPLSKGTTPLHAFAREVANRFESSVQTEAQKDIWFKRNCRCLKDILEFCGKDTTLALRTILKCILRLKESGLTGGYEAVCRNLPDYYAQAKAELECEGHLQGPEP